jgi:hypothetical protein
MQRTIRQLLRRPSARGACVFRQRSGHELLTDGPNPSGAAQRFNINMLSAEIADGHFHYMLHEGRVTAAVFIDSSEVEANDECTVLPNNRGDAS